MATAPSPLSHHDILGIVEPFTRRSRQLDLAASDRLNRRLLFKPIEHAANRRGAAPPCAKPCNSTVTAQATTT